MASIMHVAISVSDLFFLSATPFLLWCVRDRMIHLNTYIYTILNELILDILTTIFISKDLEFPPRLVFNQILKDFEEAKNSRLVFQEVNPA